MTEHNRESDRMTDMPGPLRWFLFAFNKVGYPVMVTCFLGYMLFVENVKSRKSMDDFKDVMISLKASIDQQTKAFKHRSRDE